VLILWNEQTAYIVLPALRCYTLKRVVGVIITTL